MRSGEQGFVGWESTSDGGLGVRLIRLVRALPRGLSEPGPPRWNLRARGSSLRGVGLRRVIRARTGLATNEAVPYNGGACTTRLTGRRGETALAGAPSPVTPHEVVYARARMASAMPIAESSLSQARRRHLPPATCPRSPHTNRAGVTHSMQRPARAGLDSRLAFRRVLGARRTTHGCRPSSCTRIPEGEWMRPARPVRRAAHVARPY